MILYLSSEWCEDSILLWKAAKKIGWDVTRLSYSMLEHLSPQEVKKKTLYGSREFVNRAASAMMLKIVEPSYNQWGSEDCEKVKFDSRFRSFCFETEIKTISTADKASATDWMEAEQFTKMVIGDPVDGIDRMDGVGFVLDVGKLSCGTWSVIGAECAATSRLMGCDPIEVLKVIEKVVY